MAFVDLDAISADRTLCHPAWSFLSAFLSLWQSWDHWYDTGFRVWHRQIQIRKLGSFSRTCAQGAQYFPSLCYVHAQPWPVAHLEPLCWSDARQVTHARVWLQCKWNFQQIYAHPAHAQTHGSGLGGRHSPDRSEIYPHCGVYNCTKWYT